MDTTILIIVFVLLLLAIKARVHDTLSKFALYSFVVYWYVSLISSTFSPYQLLEVSFGTYLLLILGTCSFVIGMLALGSSRKNNKVVTFDRTKISRVIEKLLKSKILFISYILTIVYFLQFAITAVALAALQGHAEMQEQNELIFMGNDLAQVLFGYVATPLFHIALILMAYIFQNLKGNIARFIVPLIILLLYFIEFFVIAGGRSTVIIALIYFAITYVCLVPFEQIRKISFKKILGLLIIGVVIAVSFTYMNLYRSTGTFDKTENEEDSSGGVVEMVARYSLSPIVMFDRSLKYRYVDMFGYQYGKATLMGFDVWISTGLRQIGFTYKTSTNIPEYLEDNYFAYDKKGTLTNYAYTGLLYHYLDFGVLGVFLFPFLFGLLSRMMIMVFYKRTSFYSFLLIGINYFMMMHSLFTCYFLKAWVALYVMVLLFLVFRKNKSR